MSKKTDPLVCVADFEHHAQDVLPKMAYDFYRGGAGDEETLTANKEAFKKWHLIPRVLRGIEQRGMTTTLLGQVVRAPFGIAPVGAQAMAHPQGERATAKAAADEGVIFILSTLSNTSIEDIADVAGHGTNWLQLYLFKDRQSSIDLITRAEKCGFKALVLTVDTPIVGKRRADLRNKFTVPSHLRLGNFLNDAEKSTAASKATSADSPSGSSALVHMSSTLLDPSLSWKDVTWLKTITRLPVIVKGILSAEDAELAVQHGVDAIVVSNHGGRQLDGVPATIDVLPSIVDRVRGRCDVYLDGGVTQGTDILKALALGAKMVFFGRAAVWGLAHSGEDGVKRIIQLFKEELDNAMALCGIRSVSEISRDLLWNRQSKL